MSGMGAELAAFDRDLCDHFLSLPPEEINSIRASTDKKGKAGLREAHVFITKHELHAWVTKQNDDHGTTPTVGDTLIHRDELSADQAGEAGEASTGALLPPPGTSGQQISEGRGGCGTGSHTREKSFQCMSPGRYQHRIDA